MYLSDFERAPSSVMSNVFPDAEPIKCVFHLSQSNRKWACKHGMANFYKNEHLMYWIVLFSKLAYLPKRDVIHGYLALVEAFAELVREGIPTSLDQSRAAAFMEYFRKTYLVRGIGARIRPAAFPIHVWNVNKPIRSQLPATNNAVESWNREYKAHFAGGGKPDRSKVIQFQVEEEEAVRHAIERHEDNPEEAFRLVRPNQRQSEQMIHALVMEWEESSAETAQNKEQLMTFLHSIQEALWYAKGFHPDLDDIEESDESDFELELFEEQIEQDESDFELEQ